MGSRPRLIIAGRKAQRPRALGLPPFSGVILDARWSMLRVRRSCVWPAPLLLGSLQVEGSPAYSVLGLRWSDRLVQGQSEGWGQSAVPILYASPVRHTCGLWPWLPM